MVKGFYLCVELEVVKGLFCILGGGICEKKKEMFVNIIAILS